MTPQVRQWLYTISALATALVPLLVVYKVVDQTTGSAWVALFGVLGSIGSGTAAVVTAKQRRDGTLDFTGSAAEQAVAAIQATVTQAASAATDLERVKTAVTDVLSGLGGPAADSPPAAKTGSDDPSSADYQP